MELSEDDVKNTCTLLGVFEILGSILFAYIAVIFDGANTIYFAILAGEFYENF